MDDDEDEEDPLSLSDQTPLKPFVCFTGALDARIIITSNYSKVMGSTTRCPMPSHWIATGFLACVNIWPRNKYPTSSTIFN